jgi:hypothetical protein
MSNTTKTTKTKTRGSNITPKTRKSYYNSDSFSKRVKDGIENYQVYLNGRSPNRAQKEAIKFFAAPFEREFKK